MVYLLLVIAFTLGPDGNLHASTAAKAFSSKSECEASVDPVLRQAPEGSDLYVSCVEFDLGIH